jgi:hypothetical protein
VARKTNISAPQHRASKAKDGMDFPAIRLIAYLQG